jgi:DNA-binding NtrC family response regulator
MDPRRALVVTDIDLSGWALRKALTSAGFVVLSAADADAARAVIEVSDPFNVVVVSLSLGAARVSKLLEYSEWLWPGVPAVVLAVDPESQPVATRADDVVLEKPYSIEDVVALATRIGGDPTANDARGVAPREPAPQPSASRERDS